MERIQQVCKLAGQKGRGLNYELHGKIKTQICLSDKGAKGMIRAFIAVTLANLVLMLPVGLLYVLSSYLLEGELPRDKFWLFIGAIVGVLLLIALTTAVFSISPRFTLHMLKAV